MRKAQPTTPHFHLWTSSSGSAASETKVCPQDLFIIAIDFGCSVGSVSATGKTGWAAIRIGSSGANQQTYGSVSGSDQYIAGVMTETTLVTDGGDIGSVNKFVGPIRVFVPKGTPITLDVVAQNSQVMRCSAVLHCESA